ncbi:Sir2 family NAD+-dependent deacetylase [Permianibacter aggregans]|uniref:NAD-dependent protein deacylase n=1 Tax=Permianibacter aggregans TaxID=1510150 RepID=A0A4V3D7X9_9GAMM|nr:Sir2 family NAD+-dependent deacetylase [Permianibacter aggregans]TDQ49507.1 NAD-dependent deacetylase [Permianibacter aggregans]
MMLSLDGARSIVVLTGAGISAESGIKTFRASDGLWEDHRVDDVATPEGFRRNPALVHHFYNRRRQQLLSDAIQPNKAHQALADFERQFAGDFLLVTQNIDDLHERAGSRKLIHMHGELLKMRCAVSGRIFECRIDLSTELRCECCHLPSRLRPHVVWFHEMPLAMERIFDALSRCDVFVSIGTSGNVYPAAGFVEVANQAGAKTIELNLEPSLTRNAFQYAEHGLATELVPKLFRI